MPLSTERSRIRTFASCSAPAGWLLVAALFGSDARGADAGAFLLLALAMLVAGAAGDTRAAARARALLVPLVVLAVYALARERQAVVSFGGGGEFLLQLGRVWLGATFALALFFLPAPARPRRGLPLSLARVGALLLALGLALYATLAPYHELEASPLVFALARSLIELWLLGALVARLHPFLAQRSAASRWLGAGCLLAATITSARLLV